MKHLASLASLLTLAATISATPLTAQAADSRVQVAVEIKDIKIELIDLTPDDGNTPWIEYTYQRHYGYATGGMPYEREYLSGAGEVTIGGNGNSAAIGGAADRIWAQHELVAGQFAQQFETLSRLDLRFNVSPWTGVRFSALGSIDGDSSGDGTFRGELVFEPGLEVEGHYVTYKPGLNETGEWTMTTLVSSRATQLGGHLAAYVRAQSYVPAAPVPEPSTYGMLLAGLGIIGAAVRRKQRA